MENKDNCDNKTDEFQRRYIKNFGDVLSEMGISPTDIPATMYKSETYIKIDRDCTQYTFFVIGGEEVCIEKIKLLAKVFNINYIRSRDILLNGSKYGITGKAHKIIRIAKILSDGKIKYHITPNFEYNIDDCDFSRIYVD